MSDGEIWLPLRPIVSVHSSPNTLGFNSYETKSAHGSRFIYNVHPGQLQMSGNADQHLKSVSIHDNRRIGIIGSDGTVITLMPTLLAVDGSDELTPQIAACISYPPNMDYDKEDGLFRTLDEMVEQGCNEIGGYAGEPLVATNNGGILDALNRLGRVAHSIGTSYTQEARDDRSYEMIDNANPEDASRFLRVGRDSVCDRLMINTGRTMPDCIRLTDFSSGAASFHNGELTALAVPIVSIDSDGCQASAFSRSALPSNVSSVSIPTDDLAHGVSQAHMAISIPDGNALDGRLSSCPTTIRINQAQSPRFGLARDLPFRQQTPLGVKAMRDLAGMFSTVVDVFAESCRPPEARSIKGSYYVCRVRSGVPASKLLGPESDFERSLDEGGSGFYVHLLP
jgi:hypothetical protein